MINILENLTEKNYASHGYTRAFYDEVCAFREMLRVQPALENEVFYEDPEDEDAPIIVALYEVKLSCPTDGFYSRTLLRTMNGDEAFNFFQNPMDFFAQLWIEEQGLEQEDFATVLAKLEKRHAENELRFTYEKTLIFIRR